MQERQRLQMESDRQCVLQEIRSENCDSPVCNHDNSSLPCDLEHVTLQEKVAQYSQGRQKRLDNFLNNLQSRRDAFLENLLVKQRS